MTDRIIKYLHSTKSYYFKQKATGLILAIISVLSFFIEHDATLAVIFIPLGIFLMVTKAKCCMYYGACTNDKTNHN